MKSIGDSTHTSLVRSPSKTALFSLLPLSKKTINPKDSLTTASIIRAKVFVLISTLLACMGIISCTPDVPDKVITQSWQDDPDNAIDELGSANKAILQEVTASSLGNSDTGATDDNEEGADPAGYQSRAVIKANQTIAKSYGHPKADDAKLLEESLRNSYARLAAERRDICPKLLQRSVDTNVIQRSNDIMIEDHCDYFIYPQPGQHIQAKSNNDQLKLTLVAPVLHDFANGDFKVVTSQKHVIRVSYDGITQKPNALSYSVSVILN